MKKTTVVIPNYNGLHFMEDCLSSLSKSVGADFDILVVDNASTDGSVAYMQEHYPEIKLIVMDENYGFSRAVNEGIRASETPYVLLLNNDVKVDSHFVKELTAAIEKSPRIFAVASRMIQMYHPELLDSAGDYYTLQGWSANRGIDRDRNTYRKASPVFSACAGAAIYRKSVFNEIGYFDESHFAYLEDVDICYRALIYGYRNIYCPRAIVYHVGSGTSGARYSDFKVKLSSRNNIYLLYKNEASWQKILHAPLHIAGTLVKYLHFKKKGFGSAYLEGLKEGIKTRKTQRQVPASVRSFRNDLYIELSLLYHTMLYCYEFVARRKESE